MLVLRSLTLFRVAQKPILDAQVVCSSVCTVLYCGDAAEHDGVPTGDKAASEKTKGGKG